MELKNVHYYYGDRAAVKGVSLKAERGRLYALVGPNGSGKTTIAKLMSGIIRPISGDVLIDGESTRNLRPHQIVRKVGMIFQNPDYQLFESTVLDEVMFALRGMGMRRDEARDAALRALEAFGLSDYADRPPLSLSGGEKKRLTFAITYAIDPEYIIFDEPTVGQDRKNLENLRDLIVRSVRTNKGVILTSHDVEFLWPLNPWTFLIKDGRLAWEGELRSLFLSVRADEMHLVEPQLSSISRSLRISPPVLLVSEALEVVRNVVDL
ncbi:MAG: energy-coupling factor ABC transporter ATP-binding protein [Nitrososphaeria archaeon]